MTLKIAFILDDFPSMTQTFVLSQINGVIELGFDVDIYALRKVDISDVHQEVIRNNLPDRVIYLPSISGSRFNRFIKGFKVIFSQSLWLKPVMLLKLLNLYKYRPAMTHLFRAIPFLKSGYKQYDVIHCQFGTVAPLIVQLIELGILKGKLVTSFRGHDITQDKKIVKGVYEDLFKSGDLFLPVSGSLKDLLIQKGCTEKRIKILHSGIDCSKFEYKPRALVHGSTVILVTTARMVEMKGLEFSIAAVARLIHKGLNLTYYIIGDGELRDSLSMQIKKLKVEDKIILTGWLRHDEVKAYLDQSHILIAPSVTASNGEKEGIPNAVKEAMAQGLPVVGTYHSGIPELVEDGVSGFLVSERNAGELSEKIELLINCPEKWPEMGLAGRNYVLDHFDIKEMNRELADIYQSLIM